MSGNTLGKLFCVTSFGESHGPAIGCVVDGCPPGLALTEADIQQRARPAQARNVAARHAAARIRHGGDPVRRVRRQDHRHADRAADPQRGRAQQGLREDRRHVPSRPRRLHVLAEVRHPRLPRRRPPIGARDRGARRRGRDREEVAARALRRRACAATLRSSARTRSRSRPGSTSTPIRSSSPTTTIVAELEAFMDELRKSGDSVRRADQRRRARRAGRLGRAGVRQARRRHRARDDGHQRGEGRRDRRRLRQRRAEGHRALRRDDAEGSLATTPAASSAASRPARTSSSSIAIKPTSSIRLDRHSIDKAGNAGDRQHARPPRSLRRHSRDADRRSDAGAGADGSCAAPSRAERRRRVATPRMLRGASDVRARLRRDRTTVPTKPTAPIDDPRSRRSLRLARRVRGSAARRRLSRSPRLRAAARERQLRGVAALRSAPHRARSRRRRW